MQDISHCHSNCLSARPCDVYNNVHYISSAHLSYSPVNNTACQQLVMHTDTCSTSTSGGLGTSIHQHKLEQDEATTCNLHMGTYMHCSCALCKLHVVAASRSNLHQWMLVPSPPDLQQLEWWCCSFQQLAQTLYLHLHLSYILVAPPFT